MKLGDIEQPEPLRASDEPIPAGRAAVGPRARPPSLCTARRGDPPRGLGRAVTEGSRRGGWGVRGAAEGGWEEQGRVRGRDGVPRA